MQLDSNVTNSISSDELGHLAEVGQFAARLAACRLLENAKNDQLNHWQKEPGDWVTQADFEAQRTIQEYLLNRFPDHRFLGEEQTEADLGRAESASSAPFEWVWIVDPLDGTVNYIHQLRSFSVSIALAAREKGSNRTELLIGCVYDPMTDEMYSAVRGQGAWLNNRPIRVSDCQELNRSILVVSSNTRVLPDNPQMIRIINAMSTPASVRRLGSAALNLCYVASGQVDAYWASNLNSWDVAAGWLIAVEAGAKLISLDSSPLNLDKPNFCCAASDPLWAGLRPLLLV